MSKLAEIQARLAMPAEMVVKLSNEHRQIIDDAKVLLDVVEAELGHYSPTYRAEHWRIKAQMAATPEAEKMCNDNADAWEALT